MRVVIEYRNDGMRYHFYSLSDLNSWLRIHGVFMTPSTLSNWFLYRENPYYKHAMFIPYDSAPNLLKYCRLKNLLGYGKKEKNPRFCSPCGNPIGQL